MSLSKALVDGLQDESEDDAEKETDAHRHREAYEDGQSPDREKTKGTPFPEPRRRDDFAWPR